MPVATAKLRLGGNGRILLTIGRFLQGRFLWGSTNGIFLTFSQAAPGSRVLARSGAALAVMLEGCCGSPAPKPGLEVRLEHPFGRATSSPAKRIHGLHQPGGSSAAGSGGVPLCISLDARLCCRLRRWHRSGSGERIRGQRAWHEAARRRDGGVGLRYSGVVRFFGERSVTQGGKSRAWRGAPQKGAILSWALRGFLPSRPALSLQGGETRPVHVCGVPGRRSAACAWPLRPRASRILGRKISPIFGQNPF